MNIRAERPGHCRRIAVSKRPVAEMVAVFAVILAFCHLAAVDPARADDAASVPAAPREFRGVWVATVANIDWPSKPGLPASDQQAELLSLLDRAAGLHLNAIVFQIRPAADALYPSELEPWSEFLTGEMGRPPSEEYDPLAIAVEESHRRGLELHAWFNPYRALHPASKGAVSDKHVSRTHPEWVRTYGKYLWLDPGEPAAVDHSLAVIGDVVRRYDIDGVHLDDYFYPYPIRDESGNKVPFPDDASWERAVADHDPASGPMPRRDDWRRQNVDRFIERMYREVKQEKPWVKVGISPFGIWRPGHPQQIKGFDQYAELYADARKWIQEGWVDYLTPQLYWEIEKPAQSYPVLLEWWHEQNPRGRHLWPGNFTSRVGFTGSRGWTADEIVAQIGVTRDQPGATGNVHFSMKPLARNTGEIADRLRSGPYRDAALVPATPWLADPRVPLPVEPTVEVTGSGGSQVLRMHAPGGDVPWLRVVRLQYGNEWRIDIVPGHQTEHTVPTRKLDGELTRVAVSAVNRLGQESTVAQVDTATR